jgi:hypothetical protein
MNSATAAMLDGIKEACEAWGRAMRWIIQSSGEGYPTMATIERARGGELDAKSADVKQRFGEVMCGDALAVSRAIRTEPRMPEDPYRVMWMQYVIPRKDAQRNKITVLQKAQELGYEDRKPYYTALENAHHFLLGRITVEIEAPGVNSRVNGEARTLS